MRGFLPFPLAGTGLQGEVQRLRQRQARPQVLSLLVSFHQRRPDIRRQQAPIMEGGQAVTQFRIQTTRRGRHGVVHRQANGKPSAVGLTHRAVIVIQARPASAPSIEGRMGTPTREALRASDAVPLHSSRIDREK